LCLPALPPALALQERTKDAQFIIISLRNNMFELADRLVGIYKTHDVTKSITINPKKIAADCAAAADGAAGDEDVPPAAGAGKAAAAVAAAAPAPASALAPRTHNA